jgi:hypothetical protein
MNEQLKDVVWTDETSIQLETHRRFCCRKRGQQARLKPRYNSCNVLLTLYNISVRPKHPVKVHVWAGISWEGTTPCVIFEGKMNASGFIEVLEAGLKPFMANTINNPRFMQDNDPKHTSARVGIWMERAGVNWWRTPRVP